MNVSRPTPIVSANRQSVKCLLADDRGSFDSDALDALRCRRCGYIGADSSEVNRAWSPVYSYPTCRDQASCNARADALRQASEPTIIRMSAPEVRCECCNARLSDGVQRVRIANGRIMHWSHALCSPRCLTPLARLAAGVTGAGR